MTFQGPPKGGEVREPVTVVGDIPQGGLDGLHVARAPKNRGLVGEGPDGLQVSLHSGQTEHLDKTIWVVRVTHTVRSIQVVEEEASPQPVREIDVGVIEERRKVVMRRAQTGVLEIQ